ncbi:MAG: M90 family metallopeptidase [Deltaproteobacteria bacterium]|nr:M90 family metallopeptidase [Deltaproteobacteria bacterium]
MVYPEHFHFPGKIRLEDGTVREGGEERIGESWDRGSLILSWRDVLRGGARFRDGRNVVLHEFAHQIDAESGPTNGAPAMPTREMTQRWADVFSREYERHVEAVDLGARTVIDPYGAEHPAEFFAVVTEAFFEKPKALRRRHPDIYALMKDYFCQDPAQRFRKREPEAEEEPQEWIN